VKVTPFFFPLAPDAVALLIFDQSPTSKAQDKQKQKHKLKKKSKLFC
jgi:hypothetical protein